MCSSDLIDKFCFPVTIPPSCNNTRAITNKAKTPMIIHGSLFLMEFIPSLNQSNSSSLFSLSSIQTLPMSSQNLSIFSIRVFWFSSILVNLCKVSILEATTELYFLNNSSICPSCDLVLSDETASDFSTSDILLFTSS